MRHQKERGKKGIAASRDTRENGWMFTLGAPLSSKYGVSLCWKEEHSEFKIFHSDDPKHPNWHPLHHYDPHHVSDQGKRGSNNQKILSRQNPNV